MTERIYSDDAMESVRRSCYEAVLLAIVVAASQPCGAELSGLPEQAAAMEVEDRRGGA